MPKSRIFYILSVTSILSFLAEDVKSLYLEEWKAVETSVAALEGQLKQVRSWLEEEEEMQRHNLHQALENAIRQQTHLQEAMERVPQYVPTVARSSSTSGEIAPNNTTATKKRGTGIIGKATAIDPSKISKSDRKFVSQDEFDSVSSYMRGRLSVDKVNAALDELANHADANAVLVTAARKHRTTGYDRKHAMWLLSNVANHPSVKGSFFILESDLKSGQHLKLDKTSKSILTILRHLGRIKEVRIQTDGPGPMQIIYTLL